MATGSSRGLGRAIAEGLLERGELVVATARNTGDLEGLNARFGEQVQVAALDVTRPEDAKRVVEETVQTFGRLDVVVNNAGYGIMGAFEEQTLEQFAGQIDVNFWGTVNVCRAALPILRKQRSGHIMNVTSIGGRRGRQGLTGYQTAKFAVEGFSEVLFHELKAIEVKMTIVEPGGFRTDWAGASMTFTESMEEYEPAIGPFREFMKSYAGTEPGDPEKVAGVLFAISRMTEPPMRLVLGKFAKQYMKEGYEMSLAELERWSELTLSTDFEDAEAHALPK
ncbi:MAG TPA: SDR family NAD(P)-dependent oxidoreductase [Acidobacteriaceae bacterium]|jgi:NAD(P)-dependent dehydrogenase (short-subunit alcohol dehydrogenase family)